MKNKKEVCPSCGDAWDRYDTMISQGKRLKAAMKALNKIAHMSTPIGTRREAMAEIAAIKKMP